MMEMMGFEFMRNALAAALLASLACGIIGSLVVVNRQVFMAGGVAHAAYGGVGLAFFLGLPVLPCTVGFTVCAALLMAHAAFGRQERSDAFVGVMWAGGMAAGIILMDLTPGYNVDLMSYLFGSILAVPRTDIWLMLGLDALIVGLVWWHFKDFLALSFDPEFARSTGVPVQGLYYLLQALTALTVVMVIQVAGLILVIALLTIPPMLAELWTNSLITMMIWASLASLVFCLLGLTVSYRFDLTSGASIIAVATLGYLAGWGLRAAWHKA
ncbi:MAG: metal ABC transporter permease [Desulfovibrionales bacterium]|nr:metal ABC transporter permease [Desulfovibrionales bacterium]